jgi:hypothetical protein
MDHSLPLSEHGGRQWDRPGLVVIVGSSAVMERAASSVRRDHVADIGAALW